MEASINIFQTLALDGSNSSGSCFDHLAQEKKHPVSNAQN